MSTGFMVYTSTKPYSNIVQQELRLLRRAAVKGGHNNVVELGQTGHKYIAANYGLQEMRNDFSVDNRCSLK